MADLKERAEEAYKVDEYKTEKAVYTAMGSERHV
jgi:hypothetical protein